ncbi:MAG: hypothetical protein ACJ75J_06085 [Cytophagaceae bacterium]
MDRQYIVEELLRKKGIGPQGSKSLKAEELAALDHYMLNDEVSLTTRATMLTALLTLPPNEDEKGWIEKLKVDSEKKLPQALQPYIRGNESGFIALIRKIINLQELTAEEGRQGMDYFFDKTIPDYLKASFLEAERLKRESFTENRIFFEYLWSKTDHIKPEVPLLIDICDSYDGANRTRVFSPFLAALLASCGFPSYLHGLDQVAPKQGVTAHQILKLSGKNPLPSIRAAKADLENPSVGWTYIDQQIFFPELYSMKTMRKEMVKRPFLATFEKLLQPFQAEGGNYMVTGYTHPHYKDELVAQLRHQQQCRAALVLKGAEGATQLSLSKDTVYVLYDGNETGDGLINPAQYGLQSLEAKQDKSLSAKESAEEGLEALRGEKNYARENMLYLACTILDKMNLCPPTQSLPMLQESLDSGKALSHWEMGCR